MAYIYIYIYKFAQIIFLLSAVLFVLGKYVDDIIVCKQSYLSHYTICLTETRGTKDGHLGHFINHWHFCRHGAINNDLLTFVKQEELVPLFGSIHCIP